MSTSLFVFPNCSVSPLDKRCFYWAGYLKYFNFYLIFILNNVFIFFSPKKRYFQIFKFNLNTHELVWHFTVQKNKNIGPPCPDLKTFPYYYILYTFKHFGVCNLTNILKGQIKWNSLSQMVETVIVWYNTWNKLEYFALLSNNAPYLKSVKLYCICKVEVNVLKKRPNFTTGPAVIFTPTFSAAFQCMYHQEMNCSQLRDFFYWDVATFLVDLVILVTLISFGHHSLVILVLKYYNLFFFDGDFF